MVAPEVSKTLGVKPQLLTLKKQSHVRIRIP